MPGLRLIDLIMLKNAGDRMLQLIPKRKQSSPTAKKLREAVNRASKLIKEQRD